MSTRDRRRKSFQPNLEVVEARTLMSGFAHPGSAVAARPFIARLRSHAIRTDPGGVAAILNALRGGAGSEFVKLIRREVPNLNAVIRSFTTGRRTQFNVPGVAVRIPGFQERFVGRKYDHLAPTVAGAIVLRNQRIELAGIMMGPFNEPVPAYVVFGINRGAGASIGPRFANRPGITPDLIVAIQVAPYGASASGTITDLKTGAVATIDPSRIHVAGPTVRVFLDPDQVPSTGLKPNRYQFTMWTQGALGDVETVGGFVPDSTMIRIGSQGGRRRGR